MTRHAPDIGPRAIVPKGRPAELRYCREDGHPFYPARHDQDFCSPKCRSDFHRRRYDNGAKLYDVAVRWADTGAGNDFADLDRLARECLAEERKRESARQAKIAAHRAQASAASAPEPNQGETK